MMLRYLGPFKATFLLSKLEDDRPILEPCLYGLRLNIKPIPSLELGVSHIAIFGGEDVGLRLSEITEILYSNQNLTGYKERGKYFKTILKGSYQNSGKAWEIAYGELGNLTDFKLLESREPFEVYVNNPRTTPNPAELITEIYLPVVNDVMIQ